MAHFFGSTRCHNQQATDESIGDGVEALLAQVPVSSSSQAIAQRQLRSSRSADIPRGKAGSPRRSGSTSSASSSSTGSRNKNETVSTKSRLGRTFGLLCLASSLAGHFSPFQPVSARSLSPRRHAAPDFAETSFSASLARQRHEQQGGKLEQRKVTSVKEVKVEAHGSDIAALRKDGLEGRWGHSATYLAEKQTILFVGGQIANGSSLTLTSDVFALNVSSLATNSTSGPLDPWKQLPSDGISPHAFAGHALTQTSKGHDQIWLMGGYTSNCSAPAAWTWTAETGVSGSWSDVETSEEVTRKARAVAIGVPADTGLAPEKEADGSAVMVLGGLDVGEDCSDLSRRDEKKSSTIRNGAVVWQFRDRELTSARELAVNDAHGTFSLVDYSTVTVPEKGLGNSTIFFGGVTNDEVYADWNKLWSFNPWTSMWEELETTGEAPTGRRGHTSTLISGNRVLVYGGLLEGGDLADDVYILNLNKTPAVWSKPIFSKESKQSAPAKAYQTALVIDEVVIMAFGATYNSTAASRKIKRNASADGTVSVSAISYLDISDEKGWRWSSSIDGILQGRGVLAVPTSTPTSTKRQTSSVAPIPRPTVYPPPYVVTTSSFTAAPAVSTTADGGAGLRSTSSDHSAPTSPGTGNDDDDDDNTPTNTAATTGAVVGSLLGAAAFAVVLGGLYAYKKRKDSYKEWEGTGNDLNQRGSDLGGGSGRGNALNAPPVSMLWFHDLKRGKPEGVEGESSLTRSPMGRPRFSDSTIRAGVFSNPFQPGNVASVPGIARPERVVYSSLSFEEHSNADTFGVTRSSSALAEMALPMLDPNGSSESLASSTGAASHCSYPYLSAMHRPSLGGSQSESSPNPSTTTPTPVLPEISPISAMGEHPDGFMISPVRSSFEKSQPHRFSARETITGWDPQVLRLKSAALHREAGEESFDSIAIDVDPPHVEDEEGRERVAELNEQRVHVDLRHHLSPVVSGSIPGRDGRAYSLSQQSRLAKTLSTSSAPVTPHGVRVTSGRAKRSMLRVTNASQEVDW